MRSADSITYEDGAGNRYYCRTIGGNDQRYAIFKRPFGSMREVMLEELEPSLFSEDAENRLKLMAEKRGWEVLQPYTKQAASGG